MSLFSKEKRLPSPVVAYGLFIVVLFILGVLNGVVGLNLKLMVLLCIILTVIVGVLHGVKWGEIMGEIIVKVKDAAPMLLILLGIGFLMAAYMMAGTAPVLVGWLTNLISPKFIVVLTFILTALFSEAVGTSFGTLGTLGIIMFGTASVMGVNPGLAAAAVVCGINFGGLLSPFNDSMASLPAVYGGNVRDMIRYNFPATAISAVISLVFFFIVGLSAQTNGAANLESIEAFRESTFALFHANPLVLLPLVLAIVFVFLKVDIIVNLFVSGIVGLLVAITVQGFSFNTCMNALYNGFNTADFFPGVEISDGLSGLLNRGGMYPMGDSIIFVLLMVALGAALNQVGIFEVISRTIFKKITNGKSLNAVTGVTCGVLACVTMDGIPTGIVAKDMFSDVWRNAGYDPKGIMKWPQVWGNLVGNLAPWGFCANYFAGILGVGILQFAPFCLFLILNPIIMIVLSLFGIGFDKLPAEATPATSAAQN